MPSAQKSQVKNKAKSAPQKVAKTAANVAAKAAPQPSPKATIGVAEEVAQLRVSRPLKAAAPLTQTPFTAKPTLWQRIWYGKNAEKIIEKTEMAERLDEVKAGVLNEMQAMAQKGGVAGSPFASVVLPRAAAQTRPAAVQPVRRNYWLAATALALVVFGWFGLRQLVTLPGSNVGETTGSQTAAHISTEPAPEATPIIALTPAAPEETRIEFITPPDVKPLAPEASAPTLPTRPVATPPAALETAGQATQKPATQAAAQPATQPVGQPAAPSPDLANVLQARVLSATPVQGATGSAQGLMLFTLGLTNSQATALNGVSMRLTVRDMAGKLIWQETISLPEAIPGGATTQQVRLTVPPTKPASFLLTAPLKAFKVKLEPLSAME